MTILTHETLGQTLMDIVKRDYVKVQSAADFLGVHRRQLYRAYRISRTHATGFNTILAWLRRLGYEVHFEIRKIDDADSRITEVRATRPWDKSAGMRG